MESWDVVLTIGQNHNASSLSDALDMVPAGTHRGLIKIRTDFQQDADVNIPIDRGIQYVKITGFDNIRREIDFIGYRFFANGIPLEIDSTIYLKDCFLFGGSLSDAGKTINRASSQIILKGKCDYLFGGGYAIGTGSISSVLDISINVSNGRVLYLYGGGYGVHQGVVNSDRINIQVNSDSSVIEVLYGGSCLPGPECLSFIREINLYLSGKIYCDVFLSGYAAYGSSIRVNEIIRLNAAEARFKGNIYDKHTVETMSAVSIAKITGYLSKEYQDQLHISYSNIQIIQPEPEHAIEYAEPVKQDPPVPEPSLEIKTNLEPETPVQTLPTWKKDEPKKPETEPEPAVEFTEPAKQDPKVPEPPLEIETNLEPETSAQPFPTWAKNEPKKTETVSPPANVIISSAPGESIYEQHFNTSKEVTQKPKKKRNCCGIFLIILFGLILIIIILGSSTENNNKVIPTATVITSTPTLKPAEKTNTPASTTDIPSQQKITATMAIIEKETALPSFSATPAVYIPSATITPAVQIPSPARVEATKTPTETPIPASSTPTETELPIYEPSPTLDQLLIYPDDEMSSASHIGIIQEPASSGTLFYLIPDRSNEYVIRTLTNGTKIEILNGPVFRNLYDWYEIYVEEIDRTGWVLSGSFIINK